MPVKAAQEPSGRTIERSTVADSTTAQRDAARRNRHIQIDEKLRVLAWAIQASGAYAHLCRPEKGKHTAEWNGILCVHSSAGQLSWRITHAEADELFAHLPVTPSDWDKSTQDDKRARLTALATPTTHAT